MRLHVISAVFSRNVSQYFSGVLGYLFIVVFVMVCAILTFNQQFFADNLSNLDQLSKAFPALLLVLVPAITMTVWAEEKRQGTDSILFTLPASDLDIMLGKYLAVCAVYTIALVFSMTQLIALEYIGQPDWGVITATYLGYWLAGLALLSIGMLASSLTSVVPVAFVLGTLLCAIPVFAGQFFSGTPKALANLFPGMSGLLEGFVGLEQFGIEWNLQDFSLGLVPLSNVAYFVSIVVFMLYLNLVVISRRHWSRGQQVSLSGQYGVRILSLAIALISINFVVVNASGALFTRLDLTSEKLYTLDDATIEALTKAKESEQPVTIQAFVSRDVPRTYVNAKKQFVGLLRQYQYYGGNNVQVRFVDVLPNSDESIQAKQLGIEPVSDRSEVGGRIVEQDVYLGARVNSTQDDAVLPFVDNDSSIEYELTHSITTTTDRSRKITLGIVDTDTFFAGPEIEGRRLTWTYSNTYDYFQTQYKIKNIAQEDLSRYVADAPSSESDGGDGQAEPVAPERTAPDVLLVADPSSLADDAADALVKYIKAGHPVVMLADPLPFLWTSRAPDIFGVMNAPRQPRPSPRSPYRQILSSSSSHKADTGRCTRILNAIGVDWDNGTVAWNLNDPHPNFRGNQIDPRTGQTFWAENFGPYQSAFVFVKNVGNHVAFNQENAISSGVNELLFFYPGSIRQTSGAKQSFTPLITMSKNSGTTQWDNLTFVPLQFNRLTGESRQAINQYTMNEMRFLKPNPARKVDDSEHVIAAQIKDENGMNVVFIADTDFVSDLYPEQISESGLNQELDNINFLQNAIEVLAGEEEFVRLRNRRPTPRTLSYIEDATQVFRNERAKTQQRIEEDLRVQLEKEQAKLNKKTAEIGEDGSLGFLEKIQRSSQEASDAQRRFDLKRAKLERDLQIDINRLQSDEQSNIRGTEGRVRMMAVGFAPLPAFLLACLVFFLKQSKERSQVQSSRRV